MLAKQYPYYLANKAAQPNTDLEVTDKYSGEVATRVALADAKADRRGDRRGGRGGSTDARDAAVRARRQCCEHCVKRFRERYDELAMALCIEAGKPIKDSRRRSHAPDRHVQGRRRGSGAHRRRGRSISKSPRAQGLSRLRASACRSAPCSFISPFNFPLNLAAHKVAPAIAAGCPFVLKPAETHADRRADHRRGARRDRSAARRVLDPARARRDGADLFTTTSAASCSRSPARPQSAGI